MKKRGFLLASQTVKIVIAVICIVFLVFFLTQLYFSKVTEEKGRQAASTLLDSTNSISKWIDQIKAGETLKKNKFELKNPKGWYVFSFTGAEKKPNSCVNKNCLCICENVIDYFDRQIKYCDEDGACLIIPELEDRDIEKEIFDGTKISYAYSGSILRLNFEDPKK